MRRHSIRHPQAGISSAPKVAPLRGGYITVAEAADAFLTIPRTANPNTHRAYASAIERVTALLGRGILAGVLLGRGEVQRWSLSTVAVRVVRQPLDGTAFDLRSAALRQSRGKLGCLMIVVTALMLLVVGAIGATLPADRGTDFPNYIAFMVGVVLVVLAGVAGQVWVDVRARAMRVLTVTDRHLNEHPWSRVRSVTLSQKGETAVVNGVRRHRSARLDLSFYDEPDERHLRLPDDATLHGAIAAALAAHSPEGVFRGGVSRTGATTSGQVGS